MSDFRRLSDGRIVNMDLVKLIGVTHIGDANEARLFFDNNFIVIVPADDVARMRGLSSSLPPAPPNP